MKILKNIRFFSVSLLFFVALSLPAAAADFSPLSVSLIQVTEKVRTGEVFIVDVRVENVSAKTVLLPSDFFLPAAGSSTGYSFIVKSSDDNAKNAFCPMVDNPVADSSIALAPGEYHGFSALPLSECFKFTTHGDYTAKIIFSSTGGPGVWNGTVESPPVTFEVLESRALKSSGEAAALIAYWAQNYDIAIAPGYKRKLLELGLPAAVPVSETLDTSDSYPLVSDLLSVLASLPCQESGDALIKFISSAPGRDYKSNMPEGFSAGKMLAGEAVMAIEKMSRDDLKLEKRINKDADPVDLWETWWKEHRNDFPPAIPED